MREKAEPSKTCSKSDFLFVTPWALLLNVNPEGHMHVFAYTVNSVFKTTCEIGKTWDLRPNTLVPRPNTLVSRPHGNEITSEFRTVFHSPLGVPNSQVSL